MRHASGPLVVTPKINPSIPAGKSNIKLATIINLPWHQEPVAHFHNRLQSVACNYTRETKRDRVRPCSLYDVSSGNGNQGSFKGQLHAGRYLGYVGPWAGLGSGVGCVGRGEPRVLYNVWCCVLFRGCIFQL